MTTRFTRGLLPWGLWLCGSAALLVACNLDNPGIDPPEGQIAFPIALSLSRDTNDAGAPRALFVANSNFDLRYNAGSVQAYDLDALAEAVRNAPLRDGGVTPPTRDCRLLSLLSGVDPDAGVDAAVLYGEAGPPVLVDDMTEFDDASAGRPPAADGSVDGDAGVDASAADAQAQDAEAADAGLDEAGVPEDAGLADAGAAEDAGAEDAGAAEDAGGMDASARDPLPLPPGYGPGYEPQAGVLRGILCDGRDLPEQQICCFQRETLLNTPFGDHGQLLSNEITIPSYASGLAISNDGQRLYIPTRSGNHLVYLDVVEEDGKVAISCGDEKGQCERGPDPNTPDRFPDGKLAPQATAVAAGTLRQIGVDSDDRFVATAHEEGQVSLLVESNGGPPVVMDVLGGGALASTAVSLAQVEGPAGVQGPPLLYVTGARTNSRGGLPSNAIRRVTARVVADEDRVVWVPSAPIVVTGFSQPGDLRAVQPDPRDPSRLYVLIRGTQESVGFLQLDDSLATEARSVEGVRLGLGPSRMRLATLGGRLFIFVSNYDSGDIYVIDADALELVTTIRGFSGPFDLVIDEARKFMYVGDFRSSVVRVVDVSGLDDPTKPAPRIVATLGALRFTQELR